MILVFLKLTNKMTKKNNKKDYTKLETQQRNMYIAMMEVMMLFGFCRSQFRSSQTLVGSLCLPTEMLMMI